MKLLISTAQHLLEVELSQSDDPLRAYEITDVDPWLSGHTFACAARDNQGCITAIHHKNTIDAVGGKMQDMYVVQFTPEGGVVDRNLQPNFKHVHDILFAHGYMYVTNTGRNEIIVATGDSAVGLTIGAEGVDTHHLNNLWASEDSMFVMAHNGNFEGDDVPGQIIEFRPDGNDVVSETRIPHRRCHHFFRKDNWWYYMASDHGRLVRYDPEQQIYHEIVVGGFPKGMIRVDDNLAVFTTSEHTPFVERRVESHAQIGVMEIDEFRVLELLDLKLANKGVGQINDIIRLD